MNNFYYSAAALSFLLASCVTGPGVNNSRQADTIGQLKNIKVDLKDEIIEGGLDKTIQSYQRILETELESAMTPETLQRLADLKIQKEYTVDSSGAQPPSGTTADSNKEPVQTSVMPAPAKKNQAATESGNVTLPDGSAADLQTASVIEAIALYNRLLDKYPKFERRDQVLYQLSRAYEELGNVEESMLVMNRLVEEYPNSRYIDELQFRRGEYYFARKQLTDAEDAYKAVVVMGPGSSYYELALSKLGWTFYKQERYPDALHRFIALLDHKASSGYDLARIQGTPDEKRIEDTYRVMSLIFSNLGGANAIMEYFDKVGKRSYEVNVYRNLGEYYLDKQRYADAAATYKSFVQRNPYNKISLQFDLRIIEIYKMGDFPKLVIEADKEFLAHYGLKAEYWKHLEVNAYPEVVGYIKTIMRELASYYHALYQNQRPAQDKHLDVDQEANFQQAMQWYREFLVSFPQDVESPAVNYLLAGLLLEGKAYPQAVQEYEHTAYDYRVHPLAGAAGYAAIFALREQLAATAEGARANLLREIIRSSLKFSELFPQHEKAALVMAAAVDDIYSMKEYDYAIATANRVLATFPQAEPSVQRSVWLVIAHSKFDQTQYAEAEEGYLHALQLTPKKEAVRTGLIENLAAAIYKRGEEANKQGDFKAAAGHFLRVAQQAPDSKIRPAADYDAVTNLMHLKDWGKAAEVLQLFRINYPGHALQSEVNKKIAFVYREAGKLSLAAAEYERTEMESQDIEVRRDALQVAADLYMQAQEPDKALKVYQRYVSLYPQPIELAMEARSKIAAIFKTRNNTVAYLNELKLIVDTDAHATTDRTPRTRYLAASAALELVEPLFNEFIKIKLTRPFDKNLLKKSNAMKASKEGYEKLLDYEVGEVTSTATYYLAEIYYNFSRALIESERPKGLSILELEHYELSIEEQAYPFEEKAIETHEKNLELLSLGIYGPWIDKSIEKLAKLV
ncbi:MAG: tetratricopeptide repeat protein, partial [Gallionellaceae bacterium]|nr:tetratricopeptide repeat protein [Gallionellaceae bacterium]